MIGMLIFSAVLVAVLLDTPWKRKLLKYHGEK